MKLSLNDLTGLFKLASLGKVTGGLIHNINGPLQNIGLDVEMSQYMLRKEGDSNGSSNIMVRLKRIEEELERLNQMIKTASNKVMLAEDSLHNFNEYINQELSFLHTNLYYKHNVESCIELLEQSPLMSQLPEKSILAFGWLLQKTVEELEKNKLKSFCIKTEDQDGGFKVLVGEEISDTTETIKTILDKVDFDSPDLSSDDGEADIMVILDIFHSESVIIETVSTPPYSFAVTFPLTR